jgi:phytanoyl-CoA hydroxylase
MAPEARAALEAQGYVVLPRLIPADACAAVREAFRREVKPDEDFLRARPGINRRKPLFTEAGFVREPVSDFQSLPPERFPAFHKSGLALITHAELHRAARALMREDAVVVETNVYEGNPVTWTHQDEWYFDSAPAGRLLGCWIALEDVAEGAGRFFVYPGSHKLDMRGYGVGFDVSVDVRPYMRLVEDVIARERLAREAPALDTGDVVFWTAKTIHGTMESTDATKSRASMNLHLIPASCGYIRFGKHRVGLSVRDVDGVGVHFPAT